MHAKISYLNNCPGLLINAVIKCYNFAMVMVVVVQHYKYASQI